MHVTVLFSTRHCTVRGTVHQSLYMSALNAEKLIASPCPSPRPPAALPPWARRPAAVLVLAVAVAVAVVVALALDAAVLAGARSRASSCTPRCESTRTQSPCGRCCTNNTTSVAASPSPPSPSPCLPLAVSTSARYGEN